METLKKHIEGIVEDSGGIRPAARILDVNPGVVANALNGGDSPTLWERLNQLWGVRKWPARPGIFIGCPEEMKRRFDAQRGERSRAEYLDYLMDLDSNELPY